MKNTKTTFLALTAVALVSLLTISQSVMAGDAPRDEYSMPLLIANDSNVRLNYAIEPTDGNQSTDDLEDIFPNIEH